MTPSDYFYSWEESQTGLARPISEWPWNSVATISSTMRGFRIGGVNEAVAEKLGVLEDSLFKTKLSALIFWQCFNT